MSGSLFGLPLLLSETCQTLGDAGDIYLANLREGYQTITKQGGIQFATSVHLWFDYDMMAFRAVFRVDGQAVMRSAITPPNSTITRSHFVRLAARA
jgi:HK97 family phage major capsid protein